MSDDIEQVRYLRLFTGYPWPQGTEALVLGDDSQWYLRNVWGRIRRITRQQAAIWLRQERTVGK